MLSQESADSILQPVSETQPSGDDLEYHQDFMALEADSKFKAEQQFGDTLIPSVEPNWRSIIDRSTELLRKSKDIRIAVLHLRAATRTQGVAGLNYGLSLLTQMTEKFWDTLHPQFDADDNNDPTMRLNALVSLIDPEMGLRDALECLIGNPRSVGPIRMRDVAISIGKLPATGADPAYSSSQIYGGLNELRAENSSVFQAILSSAEWLTKLEALINSKIHTGGIDFKPLRQLLETVAQACQQGGDTDQSNEVIHTQTPINPVKSESGVIRGDIQSREDALRMLDKVIQYLERTEPGNPAPLIIQRAKGLIGVSFLSIMEDLAPDSLSSIQNITGRPK